LNINEKSAMKRMPLSWLVAFAVVLSVVAVPLASCSAAETRTGLMVFNAMSLKKPMTEIARLYEGENPHTVVRLNCAGSSSLVAQITAGAPADVFAAAAVKDMDTLLEKGLIEEKTRRVFAANSIVLVAPINHAVELKGFKDLVSEKVKRIAAGNPKLTPAGIYSEEVFDYYGIKPGILNKLIYCDQVAQMCDYTARSEVDAAIVFYTDYLARQDQLALIEQAAEASHRPVEYHVAVIKNSQNKNYAAEFIALLCSERGSRVLADNGFGKVIEGEQ